MSETSLPILDAEQLGRQAMGSDAHRVEILSLFVAEVERLLRQVEKARDAQTRNDRLHAIVGAARNVGAVHLGQVASRTQDEPDIMTADIEPLADAVAQVVAHIRRIG